MPPTPYSLLYSTTPGLEALEHPLPAALSREEVYDELTRLVEATGGEMATLVRYQLFRRVRVRGTDERRAWYYVVYSTGTSTLCRFRRRKVMLSGPIVLMAQIEQAQADLPRELAEGVVTIIEFTPLDGRSATASDAC